MQLSQELKESWLLKKIKSYPIMDFTIGLLFLHQFSIIIIVYFTDKVLFLERFGFNIWGWIIGIPVIYFFQWLLIVWIASKLPREKLKQKFLKHPIATIVLFFFYITDLPNRLREYGSDIVGIFETIVYYAFISLLWWLLVCWISSKVFKRQKFKWHWYQKVIEKVFVFIPIIYKIILGLIVAFMLFGIIFILIIVIFKYSGQDLKMLFS